MKRGDIRFHNKKKVVVVEPSGDGSGAIVQEVHVDDGEEFPAGPTFFASKLTDNLDLPITWEGKQIKNEEDRYNRKKGCLERLERDLEIQIKANKEHLDALKQVGGLKNLAVLDRVIDFLAGDIRYVVIIEAYGGYEIEMFLEAITNIDTWSFKKYDGLKLMTLVGGHANGKKQLNWSMNSYSDGSGTNTMVVPCRTKTEAVKIVQEHIDGLIADDKQIHLESAVALGCAVPPEYIKARVADAKKSCADYLKRKDAGHEKELTKYNKAIQKLESLL